MPYAPNASSLTPADGSPSVWTALGRRRMDFEVTYTPEMERFRAEARAWFEANVPPSLNRRPATKEEPLHLYQQRRELGRKLGEKGWNYPLAPREYGGGALGVHHAVGPEEGAGAFGRPLPP